MSPSQYDTTRRQQIDHENKLFEETMRIIQLREEDSLGKKLYASQRPFENQSGISEVLCDYFKGAKFSRP